MSIYKSMFNFIGFLLFFTTLDTQAFLGWSLASTSLSSYSSYSLHANKQKLEREKWKNKSKSDLSDERTSSSKGIGLLALHGFGGSSQEYENYDYEKLLVYAPDFDCSTRLVENPLSKACFAQDNDILKVLSAYKFLVNKKNMNVMIEGVSNGAASAITFAGTYNLKYAKSLLLESPYADVEVVISKILGSNVLGKSVAAGASLVSKYNPYGVRPIDVVHKIQKDIPVLFICSREDKLIPYQETVRVYDALKKTGHNKVHIVILDHGEHANLSSGKDGCIYTAAKHAFYKKYGLPHDPILAKDYDIDFVKFKN